VPEAGSELETELKDHVSRQIGPIAAPDKVQFTDALPKTRSGKILRRILTRIAAGNTSDLGDLRTLADQSVVKTLIQGRLKE
jgi:acetyl-CoA synthetase